MRDLFLLTADVAAAFVVAATVTATPIAVRQSAITLPFAKVVDTTGTTNIITSDQARFEALKDYGSAIALNSINGLPPVNYPATNEFIQYLSWVNDDVGIGTPPHYYNLTVDTGSANTWAGANPNRPFVITSSTVDTGLEFGALYGSGGVTGEEYNDTVTLGPLSILNQGVAGAKLAAGFNGQDGILGLGPTSLTLYTILSDFEDEIPTVVDTAFVEGLIPAHELSVSFEPTDFAPITNGLLTFGGVDPTRFTGKITYAPCTTTGLTSYFWSLNESITYQGEAIMSSTSGVVDTGTATIYMPSDAYSRYQNATGGTFDDSTGLLAITEEQYENLHDLVFHIGGREFTLTPNAQIWPRALNAAINGSADGIYLAVSSTGLPTGSDLDFIDGQAFLERFYSVFDSTNNRVGFATTPLTDAHIN
ncbi:hypothetical protein NM688_g2820 [Phlebia brevispora]|uniref:Uncharacterized protein n=1 Tax=Phlebia brevispora TaxID=194682 RepID=A0ACC1T7E8_9APHY|nr:hypothetical protein NM688_g2820 [Phlebia brevispora]